MAKMAVLARASAKAVRVANFSAVLRMRDLKAGKATKAVRPIVNAFEVWSVPWEFPVATSREPWREYHADTPKARSLLAVLIAKRSDRAERGFDAGFRVVTPKNEKAILAEVKVAEAYFAERDEFVDGAFVVTKSAPVSQTAVEESDGTGTELTDELASLLSTGQFERARGVTGVDGVRFGRARDRRVAVDAA